MQADEYNDAHRTLLLCPLTTFPSEARFFRPVLHPSLQNGLQHRSEAMIDKLSPVRKDGIGQRIGSASHEELLQLELALITITGLDRYLVFDDPK
ncbi:hypothetical protein ASG48_05240 [Aurantimonas sp. Leaf443]|nr:hypothetical protein ASG48_05240 [Aurantimonas sp. Leaf443]